ncbi:hypothetical protein PM082_011035 [Marasmius tenuissimus]|nr:hypothetical protein PM082_011035 [Marasmius tenuissimus]
MDQASYLNAICSLYVPREFYFGPYVETYRMKESDGDVAERWGRWSNLARKWGEVLGSSVRRIERSSSYHLHRHSERRHHAHPCPSLEAGSTLARSVMITAGDSEPSGSESTEPESCSTSSRDENITVVRDLRIHSSPLGRLYP